MFTSIRNQSNDLHSEEIDWFLHEGYFEATCYVFHSKFEIETIWCQYKCFASWNLPAQS